MPLHLSKSPSEIVTGDVILVDQQKKEVRAISLQGEAYEFSLYNWPVRPGSEMSSVVYSGTDTVTKVIEDHDATADDEEEAIEESEQEQDDE
jgi:hypothetical protein